MKNIVINPLIRYIQTNNPNYSDTKIAEIRYGLVSIYILITKLVFIFLLSISKIRLFSLHLFILEYEVFPLDYILIKVRIV